VAVLISKHLRVLSVTIRTFLFAMVLEKFLQNIAVGEILRSSAANV
jgi:hypothetical protein